MKTLIKEITKINSQGVGFKLTEKASLNSGIETKTWFVSWDKIGKALFQEQYSEAESVIDLRVERGESADI